MTEAFISVLGISLFFVSSGAGLPVLYVHGNLGSSLWYSRLMDLPGCRTVAVDLPNFGRSDALPGEVSIDRYADALAAFIGESGLDRPVLVAHSLGGAVAQSLAARQPDLIRALVLVDSAPPSGLKTPESRYPVIESMRTNRGVLSAALGAVVPTLNDAAFFSTLVDMAARMAPRAWIGNAAALGAFDYTGRLGVFGKPTLVIWGRKDVVVTEAMARETAAAFPSARLEILEGVGHSVIVEAPELFKTALAEFLRNLPD